MLNIIVREIHSAYFSFEMSALIFLVLTISPFLVSSSSLYGKDDVGNCINNQVWEDNTHSTFWDVKHQEKLIKKYLIDIDKGGAPWFRRYPLCGHWGLGFWTYRPGRGCCNFFSLFFSFLFLFSTFLQVAFAIGEFCLKHRCDFVISTGDNFYHDGVESPIDEKFDTRWKDMYSHPSIAELNW